MVQEVVINKCFGGFGLSTKAVEWLRKNGYESGDKCKLKDEEYDDGSGTVDKWTAPVVPKRSREFRCSPGVIKVVKELGDEANGKHAELKVVEVPDGVDWVIDEYDGNETIEEKHRSWG
jgi:hypothetical protein